MNLERKFISAKDSKVHALLFARFFETKIGFGFGLASYLKTKPESALLKHPSFYCPNLILDDTSFFFFN